MTNLAPRLYEYVEVDFPRCSLTYGVAPCTAAIGVTGTEKCFNAPRSCQSVPHFTTSTATMRFCENTSPYRFIDPDAVPSLEVIDYSPAVISFAGDLGQRPALMLQFIDAPHGDTGPIGDKYRTSRDYDPVAQGSFWAKVRARFYSLRGRNVRFVQGLEGQDPSEYVTRHFIVEDMDGPNKAGIFTIVCRDALKAADGDRNVCPRPTTGYLAADITANATAATLLPAGIGNLQYPANGYLNLGGEEIVAYTRTGNSLLLVRGQQGTIAVVHKAQDLVQYCETFSALPAHEAQRRLWHNFAGMPSAQIPYDEWVEETQSQNDQVYTAVVAVPTPVKQLSEELNVSAGTYMFIDEVNNLLRLKSLGPGASDARTFDATNTEQNTLSVHENPRERISEVLTYFGLKNPLASLNDSKSYRSNAFLSDPQAVIDYGSAARRVVYSRWIATGGRAAADLVNTKILGRNRNPARTFRVSELRRRTFEVPLVGSGIRILGQSLQKFSGAPAIVPAQIISVNPRGMIEYVAEENSWTVYGVPPNPNEHLVVIDANLFNVNLKTLHDANYSPATFGQTVRLVINSGVYVGSLNSALPALDIGAGWASGVAIKVFNFGRVQGKGGKGGSAPSVTAHGSPGVMGGTALYTRRAIELSNATGARLWGGGGGGGGGAVVIPAGGAPTGGGGGGGGAGVASSLGGATYYGHPGGPGVPTAGGGGGNGTYGGGGDGGGPGLVGQDGADYPGAIDVNGGAGGAAGRSIDGVSFVTTVGPPGDRRGPQVN